MKPPKRPEVRGTVKREGAARGAGPRNASGSREGRGREARRRGRRRCGEIEFSSGFLKKKITTEFYVFEF